MIHTSYNLYSSLFRWAHRQDKNFVTDAFVYLLNLLLSHDRQPGEEMVRRLCYGLGSRVPDVGRGLKISTQITTEEGRPDIRIESQALLAFIEAKKCSGLGHDQLGRYRRVLNEQCSGRAGRLASNG